MISSCKFTWGSPDIEEFRSILAVATIGMTTNQEGRMFANELPPSTLLPYNVIAIDLQFGVTEDLE
jgi:hypothetical protein